MYKQQELVRKRTIRDSKSKRKDAERKDRNNFIIEDYELPESYNDTNLNLIARSPFSVLAYWDISKNSVSNIKKQLGRYFNNAEYCLRVYETTLKDFDGFNANQTFDIPINLKNKSHYIELPKDNASYCADLGFKNAQGNFEPIVRSNSILSQRNGSANNATVNWISVNEENPSDVTIYADKKYSQYKQLYTRYAQQKEFTLYGGRIPLSVEEIWAYYSKLTRLLRKVHSPKSENHLLKTDQENDIKDDFISSLSDEQGFNRNILIKSKNLQNLYGDSSANLVKESSSSDSNLAVKETSSSDTVISPKGRSFFFELNTELIVYGRTEPDATVTHGNNKVSLNPDGTFSLRFLLPDGKIPLDFTAQSFDKIEKRSINTAVERYKTMYVPG